MSTRFRSISKQKIKFSRKEGTEVQQRDLQRKASSFQFKAAIALRFLQLQAPLLLRLLFLLNARSGSPQQENNAGDKECAQDHSHCQKAHLEVGMMLTLRLFLSKSLPPFVERDLRLTCLCVESELRHQREAHRETEQEAMRESLHTRMLVQVLHQLHAARAAHIDGVIAPLLQLMHVLRKEFKEKSGRTTIAEFREFGYLECVRMDLAEVGAKLYRLFWEVRQVDCAHFVLGPKSGFRDARSVQSREGAVEEHGVAWVVLNRRIKVVAFRVDVGEVRRQKEAPN